MNCRLAQDQLPLYTTGDLTAEEADRVRAHLRQCAECRHFEESLADHQNLLRSFRKDTVSSVALNAMRAELFPRLAKTKLPWWIRLERFFVAGARRPRLAAACVVLAIIVSATLFAQLRHVTANPDQMAAIIEDGALLLPEDYKNWVFVGRASEQPHASANGGSRNVYMSPEAYREYRRSGVFPQGTVLVLESKREDAGGLMLEVSVKDRRLGDGWNYFRFTGAGGALAKKSQPLPEAEGCLGCHRNRATRDHVFTEFYPALRAGSGMQI